MKYKMYKLLEGSRYECDEKIDDIGANMSID